MTPKGREPDARGQDAPKKTYVLEGNVRVGPDGAEMFARVRELQAKAMASTTEAEIDAKIAQFEREKAAREAANLERLRIEVERDKLARAEEYAKKAKEKAEEHRAEGLVEVRVNPGPTWTRDWFDRIIVHRVPDLDPKALDQNLGTLAILRAVDVLTEKRRAGKQIANAAGFVVTEARRAMRKHGGPTTWVTEETARAMPHLIVREHADTFYGRVSARWASLQDRMKTDTMRQALGLKPLWALAKRKRH